VSHKELVRVEHHHLQGKSLFSDVEEMLPEMSPMVTLLQDYLHRVLKTNNPYLLPNAVPPFVVLDIGYA